MDIVARLRRVVAKEVVKGEPDWAGPQEAADEIKRLRTALAEIGKGEGAFSRDPLTHATNTIESMKQIAPDALAA